jgi:hypothetical protein
MKQPTQALFLKDVAAHEMTVLLDQGVYRHLLFRSPLTGNQWFEIITWPGNLAYAGDMGCYVFSRLRDMFEFFRTRPDGDKAELHINTSYWAEKLQAVDCDGRESSALQFSPELFRSKVEEHFKEWVAENDITADQAAEFEESLESEVLCLSDDGEYEARKALNDLNLEIDGTRLQFSDTWEWKFSEYTFRFIWCCYALAWAIQKYDAAKAPAASASAGAQTTPQGVQEVTA